MWSIPLPICVSIKNRIIASSENVRQDVEQKLRNILC